jgi:zinc protease
MWKDNKLSKHFLKIVLLLVAIVGLLVFLGLNVQAKEGKFLRIQEIKTQAGLNVWAVEDHMLPIVAMKFFFLDAGSANDSMEKQGLARLLSNTMDEGAGDLDSQAFQKELGDHSITLSFDTSRDGFGGKLVTLSRNKEEAFNLLSLALNKPRFDEEPVQRMKEANLMRIRSSLSEPDWMAARLLNDRAYEGHPYALNSGGTLSSLPKITPEDLRQFAKKNLTRDRLLVTVAGDIDPKTLGAEIDKIFASLPAKAQSPKLPQKEIANTGKTYIYQQPIPQTMFQVVLPAFDHKDKDYYALQVMNYIYAGAGFGSRLMEEAREKRGLTYGVYSDVQDYLHADAFTVSGSTKNESAREMLDIIRAQMTDMAQKEVTEKELADAKSYITGSMPLALSSTEDIAGILLSLRVDGLPIDYLDRFADNIRKVSAADVQRVAGRVLKPDAMLTVLVGQPQEIVNAEIVKDLPNVQ